MPKVGDKPGKGTYRCQSCGHSVTLETDADALSLCPRCGFGSFSVFRPRSQAGGTTPSAPKN